MEPAPDNFGDTDKVRAARAKLNLALESVEGDVPASFDRKNAFLVYASVSGDVERAAIALDIPKTMLERMAAADGWDEKIAGLIKLRKSGNARLVEKGINRALNFTQAQRFRFVLERLIRKLYDMTDDELMEYGFASETLTYRDGSKSELKKFNARPFADLASAIEKCHALSYQALCDTSTERKSSDKERTGPTQEEIHSTIASTIAKLNAPPPPAPPA